MYVHKLMSMFVSTLTTCLQPRTQEIEYFLGILDDVKKYSFETVTIHFYDRAEPHKKITSQRMSEVIDPTPVFPFVSLAYLYSCSLGRLTISI